MKLPLAVARALSGAWDQVGKRKWAVQAAYEMGQGAVMHMPDIDSDERFNLEYDINMPPREFGSNGMLFAPIVSNEGFCFGVLQVRWGYGRD